MLILASCETLRIPAPAASADGISQRFAILFTASDWRSGEDDLVDDSGRNATWLQTQRIHRSLLAGGVPAANIATLYLDAKTDPAEPKIADSAPEQGKRASHVPIVSATKHHLRQALSRIASRMDADDHLTIHLSLHGREDSLLYSDLGERISPTEFAGMISPIPPQQRLIVVDACFSGAFVEELPLTGSFIATAKADEYGWVERDFSFGQFFFEHANSATPRVAFLHASDAYQAAGEAHRDYIESKHGGKGIDPAAANALSFIPVWYQK